MRNYNFCVIMRLAVTKLGCSIAFFCIIYAKIELFLLDIDNQTLKVFALRVIDAYRVVGRLS